MGHRRRIHAVNGHAAPGRRLEGGEKPQHRRLPGTVRAEHRHAFAALDRELVDVEDLAAAAALTDGCEGQGRDHDAPRCWTDARVALTTNASPSSSAPNASAERNSPRRTSSTMAVVMTCVWPWMLPPTMVAAPTSERACPKAAMAATSSGR